jgi:soluble lytic murein transglycosylase-like protein
MAKAAAKIFGVSWWIWAALGGAVAFALSQSETIMTYGRKALDAANREIFKLSLPSYAQPYADVILQVAREQGVDPFILFALGDRESNWGTQLTPPGPSGKGDNGRGYGLMQIDVGSWAAWLAANAWWDPYVNVTKGAQVYKAAVAALTAPASGSWNLSQKIADMLGVPIGSYPAQALPDDLAQRAALAAYNAGAANVRMAYSAGGEAAIDKVTTGTNYSADTWDRMQVAASKFDASSPA